MTYYPLIIMNLINCFTLVTELGNPLKLLNFLLLN
jgi:hypothetical protein